MRNFAFIILGVVAATAAVVFAFAHFSAKSEPIPEVVPVVQKPVVLREVIGTSVQGREIEAYTYGTGTRQVLFVGGVHGGYEWNSVLLAHTFMDYFSKNPTQVPSDTRVTIIPALNVDAVVTVTGKEGRFAVSDVSTSTKVLEAARFNSNEVDLNRNFDCKWQAKSTWRKKTVSGGSAAFSEPEAVVLRNFVSKENPAAVVLWHSQANAVYASQCEEGILAGTMDLMNTYAKASGYPAVKTFDAYATTGAADDWLASIGIPAVTVELSSHDSIDWERNLAGVLALLKE